MCLTSSSLPQSPLTLVSKMRITLSVITGAIVGLLSTLMVETRLHGKDHYQMRCYPLRGFAWETSLERQIEGETITIHEKSNF